MSKAGRVGSLLLIPALVVVCTQTVPAQGRGASVPKPSLPNPYRLVPDWPMLPATMKGPNGRKWER